MDQEISKMIKAYSERYDLSVDQVKEIMLTDWCARTARETVLFGGGGVSPFRWKKDTGELITGSELYRDLCVEYDAELLKDDGLKRHWDHMRQVREYWERQRNK